MHGQGACTAHISNLLVQKFHNLVFDRLYENLCQPRFSVTVYSILMFLFHSPFHLLILSLYPFLIFSLTTTITSIVPLSPSCSNLLLFHVLLIHFLLLLCLFFSLLFSHPLVLSPSLSFTHRIDISNGGCQGNEHIHVSSTMSQGLVS